MEVRKVVKILKKNEEEPLALEPPVQEKKKERFELVEVPVQTAIAVRDTKEENVLDDKQILLEILNKLERIEKSVA
jgi:hypothetical protein